MAGTRASVRYAKAILTLANDENLAEVVNDDMSLIAKTVAQSNELTQVLRSNVIRSEQKKDALLKIFPKINKLSIGLFDVLIANKRIGILGEVAQRYNVLYDVLNEKEKATVTTAIAMTSDLEIKVLAKIKELTDKAVELENIVDETILGGFILRIGDKQFNASIANQLNKLKREFTLN